MSGLVVGNDIVDLSQPRTEGRSTDERFVARVYDGDERAAILAAEEPDLEMWTRWAAKEAGYKVVSKLIGKPPPFVHRAFKVVWNEVAPSTARGEGEVVRLGSVTYEDLVARVSVTLHAGGLGTGAVHAVGFGSGAAAVSPPDGSPAAAKLHSRIALLDEPHRAWSGPREELELRFTAQELDAVYSRHSAAVRLGARADLARALEVDESRLQIVCDPGPTSQRPPRVVLDGQRARADVSLSHDGRWIAWVLWLDPAPETT